MADYKTFKELAAQQRITFGSKEGRGAVEVELGGGLGSRPNAPQQATEEPQQDETSFYQSWYDSLASYFTDPAEAERVILGNGQPEERQEPDTSLFELRPVEEVVGTPSQTELAFTDSVDPVNVEGSTQGAGVEMIPAGGEPVSQQQDSTDSMISVPAYPSNETLADEYARSIFPDNPEAAAALSATIRKEGMASRSEDVSAYSWRNITNPRSDAGWLQPSIENSSRPWARKRTHQLYRLYGGEPVVDSNGNTVPLTREPTTDELKNIQQTLKDAGMYDGAIDGAFGPMSMAALNSWREQNGMQPVESLDLTSLQALGVDTVLKDHEGNPMIQYSRPANPVTPPGEQVVDITYNPYYRANGYEDVMGDVVREGANSPGAGTWRGRGPVQITNRDNYEAIAPFVLEKTGVDIMENPDAVAEDDAVSYWATVAHLERTGFGSTGSAEDWIRSINPQASTLNTRMALYRQLLPSMQTNTQE